MKRLLLMILLIASVSAQADPIDGNDFQLTVPGEELISPRAGRIGDNGPLQLCSPLYARMAEDNRVTVICKLCFVDDFSSDFTKQMEPKYLLQRGDVIRLYRSRSDGTGAVSEGYQGNEWFFGKVLRTKADVVFMCTSASRRGRISEVEDLVNLFGGKIRDKGFNHPLPGHSH